MNRYNRHSIIVMILILFCIQVASSAVMIQPGTAGDGYSWSGTTVTITGASEEYTLSNSISKNVIIHVDARDVTLDGNNVLITGIRGNPTLDLRNVRVDGGIPYSLGVSPVLFGPSDFPNYNEVYYEEEVYSGITECRNIENSSIVVKRTGIWVNGIGELYGNLDDTTSITVTATDSPPGGYCTKASGVGRVYGEISGGMFTVTSNDKKYPAEAYGVYFVRRFGVVSGGVFTITATGEHSHASGVNSVRGGEISGGEFTVTATGEGYGSASGVSDLIDSSIVSGGEFTVTGNHASGVSNLRDSSIVSGGVFTVNGYEASGVSLSTASSSVSGGVFTVIGTRTASGVNSARGGEISGGEFAVTGDVASGVHGVCEYGEILGGGFTVIGISTAYGVHGVCGSGVVSGGVFTITATGTFSDVYSVGGVIDSGIVSGGEFILTGKGGTGVYDATAAKDLAVAFDELAFDIRSKGLIQTAKELVVFGEGNFEKVPKLYVDLTTGDYYTALFIEDASLNGMRVMIWLHDANNVNEFKTRAQKEIDNLFGEQGFRRKVDWVQVAAPSGTEILLLSQKLGEKPVFLSVHCLVIGACEGINTNEWEKNNVFTSSGDISSYTRIYDDNFRTEQDFDRGVDAGNIRDLIRINENVGLHAFQAYAQNLGELTTGIKPGAFQIQVAAEYDTSSRFHADSEILLFSQTSGEKGIFLSFPSISSKFDFSKIIKTANPKSVSTPQILPAYIPDLQPVINQQRLSSSELWELSKRYGYVGTVILPGDEDYQLRQYMDSWGWRLTSVFS